MAHTDENRNPYILEELNNASLIERAREKCYLKLEFYWTIQDRWEYEHAFF